MILIIKNSQSIYFASHHPLNKLWMNLSPIKIQEPSFPFDAPKSHLLKISDLLPSVKSVNPIIANIIIIL